MQGHPAAGWSLHRECSATQQMQTLWVKNDDEFIEKELSHTAPSDHLEKMY
jgi:hypothetical protein